MKKRRRKFQFKISQKLVISCMGLCFAIICILTIQYYNYSRQVFEKQTMQYISDMLKQTGYNIDTIMGSVEGMIFDIQKEPDVQEYLIKQKKYSIDSYEKYMDRKKMNDAIYKCIMYDDNIESVIIVPENGTPEIISKTIKKYSIDNTIKSKLYDAGGSAVWLGVSPSENCITVAAQINNIKTMKPLGYVVVQLSERKFMEVLQSLKFVKDGSIFIVNQDDMIVSGNRRELAGEKLQEGYRNMLDSRVKEKFEVIGKQGQEEYVTYSSLGNKSWKLMAAIPMISYADTLVELKKYFGLIFLLAAGISVIMSVLYTAFFSRPIKKLLRAMQEFGDGNFNVICNVTSSDEIGLLSQSFNMMVYNINDLIEKVYTETMLKQEAELKSLRMQINPHFLYNTLETINWLSREKGIPEVGGIAKSLGDMMHYTINGSDFTTIADEVVNIHNYIMIQSTRYGDRIHFVVNIPEELYLYRLPKLIIQPLIENAIIHGVEGMVNGGHIMVQGAAKGRNLMISVIDNGSGMTQDKIRKLLSDEEQEQYQSHESIGVRNVNQRLKLYYGEQWGLNIQSIIEVGTEVTIVIPILSEHPDNACPTGGRTPCDKV